MGLIKIVYYPEAILKRPSSPVERIDDELNCLINDMVYTMYEAKGIGLAAPQVGRSLRLTVLDVPDKEDYVKGENLLVLLNPEIIEAEGKTMSEEGCLSVPGFTAEVPRFQRVVVKAMDKKGKEIFIEGKGLLSVALQHEIDHLNGKLFIDHLSRIKRDIFRRRFKKTHASGQG